MVTTTSAARRISSVHGLGDSVEMSIPTSAITATAAGLTSDPGSDPPDHAIARSPARALKNPSAICDRPALCTHRKSTAGRSPTRDNLSTMVESMSTDLLWRAQLHAALGDPHRLAIVDELALSDRAPSELAAMLGIDSNLLAHHLGVLGE